MRYLLTGGCGFIGSHLADLLIARGDRVVLLDDFSTGNFDNVAHLDGHPHCELVEGSIMDEELVGRTVAETDAVVHLAASVGVALIVQRPLHSFINNIRGTEVVLDACAREGRKVLVASTSEIYGKNSSGPLSEDSDRILGSTFKSRWSYATSKSVDEIMANLYWRERATPTIVVRLFNTVGPRQTGAYGMVVPRLVGQALRGDPLTVYGTGEQRRCFCHVHDTVAALAGLLDDERAVGDVFNIGSHHEVTINELARTVIAMTGSTSKVEHIPFEVAYDEEFEDMERRVPDASKIRQLIGWKPERNLDDILADVIEFERPRIAA